jgi:hypothetical protein
MSIPEQFELELGLALKHAGLSDVLAAAVSINRSYRDYAEHSLTILARSGESFTVDDVHRAIPDGLLPHHPNLLGALIGTWAMHGRITRVGEKASRRSSRHSAHNGLWIGTATGVREVAS